MAFDINRLIWGGFVNVLGGSLLVPRLLRFAIYRVARIDVRTFNVSPGCTFTHRHVRIGKDSFLNFRVTFEGEPVSIGERSQIGPEVFFVTTHHAIDEWGLSEWEFERRGIEVGDDCLLATRVVVLPGVRIASGCTVAAGAVVTRDLDVQGLYAGVPARLIRRLGAGADEDDTPP